MIMSSKSSTNCSIRMSMVIYLHFQVTSMYSSLIFIYRLLPPSNVGVSGMKHWKPMKKKNSSGDAWPYTFTWDIPFNITNSLAFPNSSVLYLHPKFQQRHRISFFQYEVSWSSHITNANSYQSEIHLQLLSEQKQKS